MTNKEEKYTLLTNIREIGVGDARIFCRAILLVENGHGMLGTDWRMRGFGTEAAWHNFQIHLEEKAFPYTLTPFVNEHIILLTESRGGIPIFTGNVLTLNDGRAFPLYSSDSDRPIDVHVQYGDICKVWEILAIKVIEYWDAPNMPHLTYSDASLLRENLKTALAMRDNGSI
jgi:hypothetical protein